MSYGLVVASSASTFITNVIIPFSNTFGSDLMGQAFVIMQIGNPQLENIYEKAIVPAIQENKLIPCRVDKHNKGNLLKNEITSFINSAQLIIADLTNERPNCYLEIGYAMGKEKYSNLILTAREDHNPDSPDHKINGPKVHFDLAGYEILWWNPSDIQRFEKDLENKIRQRLKGGPAKSQEINQLHFDEKWFTNAQKEAYSTFEDYGKVPYMEVKMALQAPKVNVTQNELLRIAEKVEKPSRGWPVAFAFSKVMEPTTDGITAKILYKPYADYWALKQDGAFYLLRRLFEVQEKQPDIMYDLRTKQIAEVILYCARLYKNLGVSDHDKVGISIRHTKLKGRMLASSPSDNIESIVQLELSRLREPNISNIEEITTELEVEVGSINDNLVEIVYDYTKKLFPLFHFFELPKNSVKGIVENLLKELH
jgi:hypothetical protein